MVTEAGRGGQGAVSLPRLDYKWVRMLSLGLLTRPAGLDLSLVYRAATVQGRGMLPPQPWKKHGGQGKPCNERVIYAAQILSMYGPLANEQEDSFWLAELCPEAYMPM